MRNVLLLSVLLLSACVAAPIDPTMTARADFGSRPDNYEQVAKEYFNRVLKDPLTARFEFIMTPPYKAYSRDASGVRNFGYLVHVKVNAKNSFGAYVGWEEHRLLVRNGVVVDEIVKNLSFPESWYRNYW